MKYIRVILSLILALVCLAGMAFAEAEQAPVFAPLGWEKPAAPYKPDPNCFYPDMTGYHDDSLDIRVERVEKYGCKILLVYVNIRDGSQLRTACAGTTDFSQKAAPVPVLAGKNNAVLAINGDFFNYHDAGIVYRNGVKIRMRPVPQRDTLIIDDHGDFTILSPTSREAFATYPGNVIHTFCFGPYLVKDGEVLTSIDHIHGLDVLPEAKDQRLAIAQLAPLSYLIITVDGSHYSDSEGMTLLEFAAYCKELGCVNAYNLDGGNSAYVLLKDEKLNAHEYIKSRNVGDIIFFSTLVPN